MRSVLRNHERTLQRLDAKRVDIKEAIRTSTPTYLWREMSGIVHRLNSELFLTLDQVKSKKLKKLNPDYGSTPPSNVKRVVKIPENVTLDKDEEELLSKGMSFVPTSDKADIFKSLDDLENFYRKVRLKAFFSEIDEDDQESSSESEFNKYEEKMKKFTPKAGQFEGVDKYIESCKKQIKVEHIGAIIKRKNVNVRELEALRKLKTRRDIVIKPADKGGAVCVWDKDKYIEEGRRQLYDGSYYKKLEIDSTDKIQKDLVKELEEMINASKLPKEAKHLLMRAPRCAAFYLLPKIHKQNIPGRPVVSNVGCPTYNISKYLSNLLKPLVKKCPSYIKDTTHLLQKVNELDTTQHQVKALFTMDVK